MNDGVLDKTYAQDRLKKKYLEFRYKERALVAVSAIKKHFKQTESVNLVDFGAAEGLTLLEIARLLGPGEYTGIEFDEGLIKSGPPLPGNVRIVQGDISHCLAPDSSVDVITALAIMEHLEHPQDALREAKRILKPGGLFVATAPVPFWDKYTDFLHAKEKFGAKAHMSQITKKYMSELADISGLEFVSYFKFMIAPVGFLPYLRISVSPQFAWYLDKALQKTNLFGWLYVNQCFVLRKPH